MYSVSIRNSENIAVPRMKPADVRARDRLRAEDAEAHQRLGVPQLPPDERRRAGRATPAKKPIVSPASQPSWPACVIA